MGIHSCLARLRGMLRIMQDTAGTTPSPTTSSFAGLLAALAAPASPAAGGPPAWNENDFAKDELADDVATLSYEHALRAHARYKPADRGSWPFTEAAGTGAGGTAEWDGALRDGKRDVERDGKTAAPPAAPEWKKHESTPSASGSAAAGEQSRKRASVTIRMSEAECAQLHQRATEAGLTVSAYLCSCTFEAEALRAEVKEALARLRAATAGEKTAVSAQAPDRASVQARRSRFGWLARLLMPRRCVDKPAQA